MKIEKDDYVIYKHDGKLKLLLALNASYGTTEQQILGIDDGPSIKIVEENIVALLGKNPKIGKVHGVTVEPLRASTKSKAWGDIHIFRKLDKTEKRALKKSLITCASGLKKKHCENILPLKLEIRNKNGKYAGYYKYFPKRELGNDIICLKPESFADEKYNTYMIYHEAGHGVWFRMVPDHIKALWLKAYSKRITLQHVDEKTLKRLAKDIVAYENGVKDYAKEIADDEQKVLIREALSYIKRVHRVDSMDLDFAMFEDRESLLDYWPVASDISTPVPDVSEYAMTNVRELFAECFAYYMVGRGLPKDVTKLMKKTLKRLDN